MDVKLGLYIRTAGNSAENIWISERSLNEKD